MTKGQINGLLSPWLERNRIKNILPFIKGRSVLDCGAGRGTLKEYLSSHVQYLGIETDDTIDKAPGTNILIADINNLPTLSEKYDHIILSEIIEHLDEPVKVIKTLSTFLTPQGTIIISVSTPFRYKFHGIASKLGLASKEAEEEHQYFPGKKELYELAQQTGLNVTRYKKTELGTKQIAILQQ